MHTIPLFFFFLLTSMLTFSTVHSNSDPSPENVSINGRNLKDSMILGFVLGASKQELLPVIGNYKNMTLSEFKTSSKDGITEEKFTYSSGPQEFPIIPSSTRLVFINDQLAHLLFLFEPSYQNFLVLRGTLLQQLQDATRFKFNEKKEEINPYLESYLSEISSASLQPEHEKAIFDSLIKGESYWFYTLEDSRKEIKVSFFFIGIPESSTTKLQLSFEYLPVLDSVRSEENQLRLIPK